jgi:signal transduction histidine kinase
MRAHAAAQRLFLAVATLVAGMTAMAIGWSWYETRTQGAALRFVLDRGGAALVDGLGHAVDNALRSNREVDELTSARLLDIARLIEQLDAAATLSRDDLQPMLAEHSLQHVALIDEKLQPVVAVPATGYAPNVAPYRETLLALAAGSADEAVFPALAFGRDGGRSFAAAVRRRRGGAVLVTMDATDMLSFITETSAASLIDEVVSNGGIERAVLEDPSGKVLAEARAGDGAPSPAALVFEHPVPVSPTEVGKLRLQISGAPLEAVERAGRFRTAAAASVALASMLVGAAFLLLRQRSLRLESDLVRANLRLVREKAKREQLAAFGRMASSVAHEIRNPLNGISMGVQRLAAEFAPQPDAEDHGRLVALVRGEIARLDRIVGRFLESGRTARPHPVEGDMAAEIRSFEPFLREGMPAGTRLSLDLRPVPACFDAAALRQILLNLTRNAVEATSGRGTVRLSLRADGDLALLDVEDDGPGIPDDARNRVFEFGYTTKERGNGMGLPIVHRLVTEMQGTVKLESPATGGTRVRIAFPLRCTEAA